MVFEGKTLCQSQWCDLLKIKRSTINKRTGAGWSVEKALSTPLINSPVLLTWNGKTMNMSQWARAIGVPYATIRDRVVVQKLSLDKVFKK